ncbi:MAG: phosphoribosylformylglycinamidine synthase I [Verrucomicrobia bacterium]|nr:MAG: phosphoribosylformylglycinamidine synthase I [Verrucomicrobiota bacterium]
MKLAVLQFPASNCDQDVIYALRSLQIPAEIVWHKSRDLSGYDAVVLPGGFSYGDYLRSGVIAKFSPIMREVVRVAEQGKLILGICNGFQILTETGLLPGALIRNRGLHFRCEQIYLRVETSASPFTHLLSPGDILSMPIAHGEGCYYADEATLRQLNAEGQVLVRYTDAKGHTTANPNGSCESIAGICNQKRNVFGLMPHPERACDPLLGSTDGIKIFQSMVNWLLHPPR